MKVARGHCGRPKGRGARERGDNEAIDSVAGLVARRGR